MALALSGPVLPASTVNDCLDALTSLIEAIPGLGAVYGYRALEPKASPAVSITSISGLIGDSPVGLSAGYDYIIDLLVRIDGNLHAAERTLNGLCDAVWRAIWGAHEPTWSDCYPYAADQKPGAPQESVNWRRAILYVRIIPI